VRAYVAGRLATALLVILGVSVVSFFLTFLTGDPAEIMLPPGATAAQIEKFRAEWGFDDPTIVQYWRFLKRAVHGDFGVSLRHGQQSLPLIAARLPATLQLTVTAMLFAIVLAGAIGLIYGAPGATMISGAVNREQNGRISAAGPASNLVICTALFAVFWFVARGAPSMLGGPVVLYLLQVLLQVSQINAVLAGFNLVPILPLDGAKVFAWSKAAYAGLAAAAIGMVILTLLYAVPR